MNVVPLFESIRSSSTDDRDLFDLISLMLEYDPNKRISLNKALWHRFFDRLSSDKKPHLNENLR